MLPAWANPGRHPTFQFAKASHKFLADIQGSGFIALRFEAEVPASSFWRHPGVDTARGFC
jgi:hypothetical protein